MIGIVCAFFHTEGKGFYSKPQRSPLRLRFLNCTLESVSCVDDTVIYETMHRIQIVGASHSCLLER